MSIKDKMRKAVPKKMRKKIEKRGVGSWLYRLFVSSPQWLCTDYVRRDMRWHIDHERVAGVCVYDDDRAYVKHVIIWRPRKDGKGIRFEDPTRRGKQIFLSDKEKASARFCHPGEMEMAWPNFDPRDYGWKDPE